MLLKFLDILNTFFQSILIVWACNNVASRDNKLSKNKYFILIGLIFFEIVVLTYSGLNMPLANFIMFIIFLLLCVIFYRKSVIDALLGVGISYSILAISANIFLIFYQNVLAKLEFKLSEGVQLLLFVYIPIFIVYFLVYKYRKQIFNAVIYVKEFKHSIIFVLLIDYALIFMDTLRLEWTNGETGTIFKSILCIVAFLAFVFATIHFAAINDQTKEIAMLNNFLNEKIVELKKVKHDYGSEITSLYGLYQLNRMDRLGELLKDIIDRDNSLNTAVSVKMKANHPLVSSVLHTAVSSGIDVIVSDSASYEALAITDKELLKLLSNIVKNSIDALKDTNNPLIKFNSYNSYNGITISITNNGPEIPKDIRVKVFDTGFSTKADINGDRGFGLSIVKDIVQKCNGNITVESNEKRTKFNVQIPFLT